MVSPTLAQRGALLTERRTVVVPARVKRADQAAPGPAEALRLPNIGELVTEVENDLGERCLDAFVRIEDHAAAEAVTGRRLHLPQAGSKPSRRDHSRRRRGLGATPDHGNKSEHKFGFRGCRSYDRRGVAPSPTLRPKAETPVREPASESQRCQRVSRTVTSEGYAHKYEHKGGLTYVRTNVAPRVTPARANHSRESGVGGL